MKKITWRPSDRLRPDAAVIDKLRGRVISRQQTQGNYSLHVIKIGPSGSSTIAQSGTFSTSANAETMLGLASFNSKRLPISSCTIEQIIGGGWPSAAILFVLARVPVSQITWHRPPRKD